MANMRYSSNPRNESTVDMSNNSPSAWVEGRSAQIKSVLGHEAKQRVSGVKKGSKRKYNRLNMSQVIDTESNQKVIKYGNAQE